MKWILTVWVVHLLVMSAVGLDQREVRRLVAASAGQDGVAYTEARAAVVALGTNALPQLAHAATDGALTWQERLAARICYERIERAQDILTLRGHDWKQYPPYRPGPMAQINVTEVVTTNAAGLVKTEYRTENIPGKTTSILGPQAEMGEFIVPRCREAGLWYYYLETYWKKTGEGALPTFDKGFEQVWPWGCVAAVEDQPEDYYRIRILIQWLNGDKDMSDPYATEFYRALREKKIPDAVPVLVERLMAYRKVVRPSTNTQEEDNSGARYVMMDIMSFADSRHADMLEKYIAEHPALAPLKEKLAEVRARPPQPAIEPPFRLGTKLVIVK